MNKITFHLESEQGRESRKREVDQLNNKLTDLIDDVRVREKDFQMAVDDARRNEIKSTDKVKNLENLLDNVNQVIFRFFKQDHDRKLAD